MSHIRTVHQVRVHFDVPDRYSDNGFDENLSELHGLAVRSTACESFEGNAAFGPWIEAEFEDILDAHACEAVWLEALARFGYQVLE